MLFSAKTEKAANVLSQLFLMSRGKIPCKDMKIPNIRIAIWDEVPEDTKIYSFNDFVITFDRSKAARHAKTYSVELRYYDNRFHSIITGVDEEQIEFVGRLFTFLSEFSYRISRVSAKDREKEMENLYDIMCSMSFIEPATYDNVITSLAFNNGPKSIECFTVILK